MPMRSASIRCRKFRIARDGMPRLSDEGAGVNSSLLSIAAPQALAYVECVTDLCQDLEGTKARGVVVDVCPGDQLVRSRLLQKGFQPSLHAVPRPDNRTTQGTLDPRSFLLGPQPLHALHGRWELEGAAALHRQDLLLRRRKQSGGFLIGAGRDGVGGD